MGTAVKKGRSEIIALQWSYMKLQHLLQKCKAGLRARSYRSARRPTLLLPKAEVFFIDLTGRFFGQRPCSYETYFRTG